jgi:hypothetical protein
MRRVASFIPGAIKCLLPLPNRYHSYLYKKAKIMVLDIGAGPEEAAILDKLRGSFRFETHLLALVPLALLFYPFFPSVTYVSHPPPPFTACYGHS